MDDEITCEEFRDMAPAYVLSALDDAERIACARHLAQAGPHRSCPEAVHEAEQVTARLYAALPARAPSPGLWRAIAALVAEVPPTAGRRWRRLSEIGAWSVAAVAIGLYAYQMPANAPRAAVADGERSTVRAALDLMTAPGTRVVSFSAQQAGAGHATLIVNAGQHRALLLTDRIPPTEARRLRLWGAQGPDLSTPLTLVPIASDGIAAADLDSALFDSTTSGHLVLSVDRPGATSPGDLLLTAETQSP